MATTGGCSRVAPTDNGRCRQASQRVLSRVEGESRYHGVVLWPLGSCMSQMKQVLKNTTSGMRLLDWHLSGARVTSGVD